MEIIIDECISESTKKVLENSGFTILQIDTILGRGVDDETIYEFASRQQIPLLTHDKRFGQIYFETTDNPTMTIILHIVSPHPDATNELLQRALSTINLNLKSYSKKLIIIAPNKIRIRAKVLKKNEK